MQTPPAPFPRAVGPLPPGAVLRDSKGHLYLARTDGLRKLDQSSLYILQRGAEQARRQRKIIWRLVLMVLTLLVLSGTLVGCVVSPVS